MNDFLEISEIRSEEGMLLVELVRHILQRNPDEMPRCYKHFIENFKYSYKKEVYK